MKNTVIIIIATLFIIADKTSQGVLFGFRKQCIHSKKTPGPNPVIVSGNMTFILLEETLNATIPRQTLHKDPTVVRKKKRCICELPVCKCTRYDNPEHWYVKTFITGDARATPSYGVKHYNSTEELLSCQEELGMLKESRKRSKKGLLYTLCPKKKTIQHGNKWLYGCPPLLNIWNKGYKKEKRTMRKGSSFQCECLRCKLQSREDKSGVLLKCVECGPIYFNTKSDKINFSKLILKRKNKLKMRTKFLQVN